MTATTLPLSAEKASFASPRRSFLLAFTIALLSAAAGAMVYFFLPLPPLPSTGQIVYLVKEKRDYILHPDVWNDRAPASFRYLQRTTILSPWLLNEALSQPGVADLPIFAQNPSLDPMQYLQSHLKADFSLGTELMRVSLEGNNPEEILAMLKAVDAAYNKFVVQDDFKQRRMRMETLHRLQSQYTDKIKAINMQIVNLPKADHGETLESLQLEKKNAEAVAAQVNDEQMKIQTEMDAPLRVMRWEEASVRAGPEDNRRVKYTAIAVAGTLAVTSLLALCMFLPRLLEVRHRAAMPLPAAAAK